MSNVLGSEQLLSGKRRYEYVTLRNGRVRIQSLTEYEKAEIDAAAVDYKKSVIDRKAAMLSRSRMICAVVVNDDGRRIFSDGDVDRVAREMDSQDVDAIHKAAVKHIGGSEDDFAELVGNSETTPSDDSQSS